MLPIKGKLTLAYALSGALLALLTLSSVVGLFFGDAGLYESYPASLAGLVGQDAFTLFAGVPLLVVSVWLAARGSARGLLVWAGALFYFAYSYFFYVVGGFNALFLVYVAIVSASLYALLSLLFAVDAQAFKARFPSSTPTRPAGSFLVVISLLFLLMWGSMSVSSAVAGSTPDAVLREVVAIDCTVLLPLLFSGGLLLWRRDPWGYVLGGMLLVKVLATGSTLAFTTALGAWGTGKIAPFDTFLLLLFALMAVGAAILVVPYLRSIRNRGGRNANLRW